MTDMDVCEPVRTPVRQSASPRSRCSLFAFSGESAAQLRRDDHRSSARNGVILSADPRRIRKGFSHPAGAIHELPAQYAPHFTAAPGAFAESKPCHPERSAQRGVEGS